KKRDMEVQMLLKEQELLYRELNHRVKNNLMMISSLLNLKEAASGEAVDLTDIKQQVEAIHLTHDELYQGKNISDIRIKQYAEEILRRIFRSFTRLNVQIESAMEDLYLPPQTALPIGLIINEVAVNAVKYGFSEDAEAVFSISLHHDQGKKEFVLTLSNTGKPFPPDIDLEHSDTLGLSLLQALTGQLGGSIELQKKPAAHYTIRFPLPVAAR
ncbi:MAG: sensor histidine kinase, partial [Sediminispirochaetaceae bacterium]